MKASELRIGNYLKRLDDSVFDVNSEDIQIIERWDSSEDLLPKPILLTEEWLIDFGFVKSENINHWVKNWGRNGVEFVRFDDYYNLFSYQLGNGKYRVIERGVHQLQNLYFALTGEELTIKE